jgi:hypothetical protein
VLDQDGNALTDGFTWREELQLLGGGACPQGTLRSGIFCVGKSITGDFVDRLSVNLGGSMNLLQLFTAEYFDGGSRVSVPLVLLSAPIGQGVNHLQIESLQILVNGSPGQKNKCAN